jgi:8-oxo-dGTP pyrophosphatase MutT (NUDIX family)
VIHREAWYVEAAPENEDKTLFESEWFTIKEDAEGWVYQESSGTVAVLPFKIGNGFESVQFLLRHENIPSMGKGLQPWLIFGGMKEHGTAEQAAIAELMEEGGFQIEASDLIDLGEAWSRKDVNRGIRLFAVDVSDMEQAEPEGDGSEGEQDFKLEWVDWYGLVEHPACVIHSLAIRLYARLYQ